MSEPEWPAFCVCVSSVSWIATLDCWWQTCVLARRCGRLHLERWTLEAVSMLLYSVSLCTHSVPLPVFLQCIINSVTACSKAPCLVVHIQSCRLKQIAICVPLGGGKKKQREAPFFIPFLHPSWIFLIWASKCLFFLPPPAVTVRASQSQSNHSNQCLPVPSRLGSSCQKQKSECPSLWCCVILWC